MNRLLALFIPLALLVSEGALAQKKTRKRSVPPPSPSYMDTTESSRPYDYVEMNSFEQTPEMFHQAPLYRYELMPMLMISRSSFDYTDNGTARNLTQVSMGVGVLGEYGFYPLLSGGITLNYLSLSLDYTPSGGNVTRKGFSDPTLFFKGRYGLGRATLRYGADLSLSIQKSQTSSDGSGNVASGGSVLTPFIGFDLPAVGATVGGRFSYDLYKGDRTTDVSSTSGATTRRKTKGGETFVLTGFYERPYLSYLVGASLDYYSSADTKTEINGVTYQNKDSSAGIRLNGYGLVPIKPDLNLLPAFTYARATAMSLPVGAKLDEASQWLFTLGLRKMF